MRERRDVNHKNLAQGENREGLGERQSGSLLVGLARVTLVLVVTGFYS